MTLAAAGDGVAAGVLILFLLGGLAATAYWIWGIVDVVRVKDDADFRAGNKLVWILLMVFAGVIGTIIYSLVGRPQPKAKLAT
jgi:hypothetical protein